MTVAVMIGISGGFLVVCWHGVSLVYAERSLLSHGELLQFVAYALIFSSAVVALSDLVGDLKRVDGAVERLVGLMDSHPGIQSPEYPVVPDRPLKGYIKFSNVSFADLASIASSFNSCNISVLIVSSSRGNGRLIARGNTKLQNAREKIRYVETVSE